MTQISEAVAFNEAVDQFLLASTAHRQADLAVVAAQQCDDQKTGIIYLTHVFKSV